MVSSVKIRFLLIIMVSLFVITGVASQAFSGGSAPEKEQNSETDLLVICPEPRPQACTRDYRSVCAELTDGSFRTFPNGCTSYRSEGCRLP